MERWHAKVICLVGIFILPLLCTLIPWKVHAYFARRGEKGKKVLSCLMCFGGGVFFATFILHMGPEVRDILNHALIYPNHINYPVADLIMGGGFFLVFFLEKVILKCHKKRQIRKKKQRQEQCYQFNKINDQTVTTVCHCENGELSENDKNNITHVANGGPGFPVCDEATRESCPLRGTGDCCNDSPEVKLQLNDSESTNLSTPPKTTEEEDEDIMNAHNTRSLVLIVALSLHRIFEGMSLGLQLTTQNVWNLFIAVLCHETVIGFGLGLQFVKNRFTFRKMITAVVLCSIIMPVGVAIGTAIVEVGGSGKGLDLVNGILQGVSTGTFIYVTFFEILQEEIDPHDTSFSKFFSVFIGFAVMAALSAVPEEQGTLLPPCYSGDTTTMAPLLTTAT